MLTQQKEYKSADGRVYWSHAQTKQSVWEKPDELKVRSDRGVEADDRRLLKLVLIYAIPSRSRSKGALGRS